MLPRRCLLAASPGFSDMSLVRVEPISDRHVWNGLLLGLADHAFEQSYEWGEILRHSGARPHRYAVFDGDRCVAAATMLSWRLPILGLSVLYISRGPVLEIESEVAWSGLLAAIQRVAAETRAVFVRASPGALHERQDLHDGLEAHGFVRQAEDWTIWNAPRIVMTLSLTGTDDDVWSRVSNSRRREIKGAAEAGITIGEAGSPADIAAFYRLLLVTGRRKRYPVRRWAHFQALQRESVASRNGLMALARHNGELLGGLLAAKFGHRAYFLYSAVQRGRADECGRTAGAALFWYLIRWARASGCQMIHWGGSATQLPPVEADPGYGVYQFKRSFGSTCVACLGYYDLAFRPRLYTAFRHIERRLGECLWRIRARLNG